jgi:hypothetical protein
VTDEQRGREMAAADKRIDALVLRAEQLVLDLNATVADMKRVLGNAQAGIQEEGDEQLG